MLKIIYQDDNIVVINKPYGYMVHKSALDPYAEKIVLQVLRDQLGQFVYPVHRLDRKTTGLLVLALNKETQKKLFEQFREQKVIKKYLAIVRGYTEQSGVVDYDLTNDKGKTQSAISAYKTIQQVECLWPSSKFQTSRYSVVRLVPSTGRMHQLRKHMSHIFHPIIGDRPHGCSKQNRLFKARFDFTEMTLHANFLSFKDANEKTLSFFEKPSGEFLRMYTLLGFDEKHLME